MLQRAIAYFGHDAHGGGGGGSGDVGGGGGGSSGRLMGRGGGVTGGSCRRNRCGVGPFGGFGVRDDEWQFTVLHHCR